jgi:hypothetical protein
MIKPDSTDDAASVPFHVEFHFGDAQISAKRIPQVCNRGIRRAASPEGAPETYVLAGLLAALTMTRIAVIRARG